MLLDGVSDGSAAEVSDGIARQQHLLQRAAFCDEGLRDLRCSLIVNVVALKAQHAKLVHPFAAIFGERMDQGSNALTTRLRFIKIE